MKVIKLEYDFEKQPSPNIFEVKLTSKDEGIIYEYSDGYKLIIDKKITHQNNNEKIEAKIIDKEGNIKLYNWVKSKEDENSFDLYNWKMNLSKKNNKYIIEIIKTKNNGGGVL